MGTHGPPPAGEVPAWAGLQMTSWAKEECGDTDESHEPLWWRQRWGRATGSRTLCRNRSGATVAVVTERRHAASRGHRGSCRGQQGPELRLKGQTLCQQVGEACKTRLVPRR